MSFWKRVGEASRRNLEEEFVQRVRERPLP